MKLVPFSLEQWKILSYGNMHNIYTRDGVKVNQLIWYQSAEPNGHILSGLIGNKLTTWDKNGRNVKDVLFHGTDLMLKIEDKPLKIR